MKQLNQLIIIATGVAAFLGLAAGNLGAQDAPPPGRGNFDPEQMRARMLERYREQLEVKNDDEWKLISERITKVTEARREVGGGFGRGMMGRPGGGRGPGGNDGGNQVRRPPFGGEPSPEIEALQKAIEAKAPVDEIKSKLAKVREARKANEAKLAAAQEELRKLLSVRQEASAVMAGLLQ